MAITIKKVTTRRELERFIRFNYLLYKNNPYSVPDLFDDMLNTFNKKKNAAFEFCEADYFLAYREGKIVGRVAAIINHKANQTWNKKEVRFGWIDFIDDAEVSDALIRTVEEWGKERGMTHIQGPLGFTDFDAEGMLIEGFDQLSTMATIYNYPYYPQHLERMGFEKDADWVEYKIYIPDAIPDKPKRISDLIQRKYNLKVKKYTSAKKIAQDYGQAIFELMNEAYQPLYGYSALSQRQIDQYVKMYLPILDLRMVTLITDADDQLLVLLFHAAAPLQHAGDQRSSDQRQAQHQIGEQAAIGALLGFQLLKGDDLLIRIVDDGAGGVDLFLPLAHPLELLQQMVDGHAIQPQVVHPGPDEQHHAAQKARGLPDGKRAITDIALPQQHQHGHNGGAGHGLI